LPAASVEQATGIDEVGKASCKWMKSEPNKTAALVEGSRRRRRKFLQSQAATTNYSVLLSFKME